MKKKAVGRKLAGGVARETSVAHRRAMPAALALDKNSHHPIAMTCFGVIGSMAMYDIVVPVCSDGSECQRVGHDCRWIRIDEYDFKTFFAGSLVGLRAGVVEFAGLFNDGNFLDASVFRHNG